MFNRLTPYKSLIRHRTISSLRKLRSRKNGLNLIGFFSYTFGVAEIGRFFAKRTMATNVPFSIFDTVTTAHSKIDDISLKQFSKYYSKKTKFHTNLFFVNADTINHIHQIHPELFIARYNAAVFFWEFDDYFHFVDSFKHLNEVIAFTSFIATALRKVAPPQVKVSQLPIPFMKSWEITKGREAIKNELGFQADEFLFIFNFDFYSVYNRKNPEAILKAFELAFTENDNVCLIFKTIHAEKMNDHFAGFSNLVDGMKMKNKIRLINENMSRNDFMSMIHASDCYISLHRSEGLGLGMMEAMSMGVPVIATRYGGNVDFMNDQNSLLVNYRLVPVEPGSEPYQAGWLWADADAAEAAGYMKQLYSDRDFARKLGKMGQASIEANYSQEKFSGMLHEWLQSAI